jgi:hypothetical protein
MFHSDVVPSPDSPQPDAQPGRYTAVPRTSPPSARKTCGPALADVEAATVAGELGGCEGVGAAVAPVTVAEAEGDVAGVDEPDVAEGNVVFLAMEVDEVLVQPTSAAAASARTASRAGKERERNRSIMVTNQM